MECMQILHQSPSYNTPSVKRISQIRKAFGKEECNRAAYGVVDSPPWAYCPPFPFAGILPRLYSTATEVVLTTLPCMLARLVTNSCASGVQSHLLLDCVSMN